MDRDRLLAPAAVEALIADGHTIVIARGRVLKLDGWLDRHPGGRLAVLHMVGRDATNEIDIYHAPATRLQMDKFRIGRVQEPWVNFTPPIRGGIFIKPGSPSAPDLLAALHHETTVVPNGHAVASGNETCITRPVLRPNATASASELPSVPQIALHLADDEPLSSTDSDTSSIQDHTFSKVPTNDTQVSVDDFIARAEQDEIDRDIQGFPSLDMQTQCDINTKYRMLHERVTREGFYDCPYLEYGKEAVRYSLLFIAFIFTLYHGWYLTSAGFLGLFWHQIMFTAHDAGHRSITHNFVVDTLIGMFIADFCCGLSIGWWKSSHNVHHLVTNHPEHDPDIQNVPLFATCPSFFRSIRSTYYDFTFVWDAIANLAVKYQTYTYYPVMGLARFNLYILSVHHLLSQKSKSKGSTSWIRSTELSFICCYWFLFGYCLLWRTIPTWPLRVGFVLISHIITVPLHVQITLSHWGMPTANLGEMESFPQRQLRTTMDVDCPAWMDFVHGGLQFQAVHHLFPRVPRHNLRRLQVLVKEFCAETGIPYKVLGFVDGNKEVLGRLTEISKYVGMLVECQKYMAETGESGLH